MASQQTPLPEYDNPPVSEVALSIEFAPLEGWRSPHAGLYWGLIKDEYPHTEAQAPLPSQIEKFGEEFWQQSAIRIELANPDLNRIWFLADPQTRLIQIQRDRFVVNWRKITGNETYPRYEKDIRPRFVREWERFKQFIRDQALGALEIRQCEVTYLNDIPQGEGWRNFSDSLDLLAQCSGRASTQFLPPPETLGIVGSFVMPNERGRLHFTVQHVMRQIDKKEVLQLRLVARGKPEF